MAQRVQAPAQQVEVLCLFGSNAVA
jgi:hypothetical protein